MKTYSFLLLSLVASCDALSQPAPKVGRRAFLSTAAGTAASIAVAVPAVAAEDPYALDLGDSYKTEKTTEKKSGNGGALVGGVLAGGFALSLPFFLPNLARLAGIKNAKQPKN